MEVTHKQLEKAIHRSCQTKIPIFIWGTTGIGKSYTGNKVASERAKMLDRAFLDWNRISDVEKQALLADKVKRQKSYIFADNRLVDKDPTDLRGLPFPNGKDYVEWKPTLLFRVLSSDGASGMLFFDEMNLAPPSVQGTAYQIVFDKCVGELALNPDIDIIGAGNRAEDRANVFDMGVPLRARFGHITLAIPTFQEWVDWGLANNVDDRILSFIQFKPSHLMADINKLKDAKSQAVNCPRTWEFTSRKIEGITDLDELEMYISECVGDGIAVEFKAFLKLREKIDLKKILDKPEQAKNLELDMKWSLISAVSEKYRADKKILDKALNLCNFMEPDFGASLLRMLKRQDERHFSNNVVKCKNWRVIAEKFGKYIRASP